eukprot:scaffold2423_cov113-Isochrysis_galbana.AAC.12
MMLMDGKQSSVYWLYWWLVHAVRKGMCMPVSFSRGVHSSALRWLFAREFGGRGPKRSPSV